MVYDLAIPRVSVDRVSARARRESEGAIGRLERLWSRAAALNTFNGAILAAFVEFGTARLNVGILQQSASRGAKVPMAGSTAPPMSSWR